MMEAKTAVGEAFNILNAKGIRAPMSNFHDTGALSGQALLTSKYSPDATHCVVLGRWISKKKKVKEKETVLNIYTYTHNEYMDKLVSVKKHIYIPGPDQFCLVL